MSFKEERILNIIVEVSVCNFQIKCPTYRYGHDHDSHALEAYESSSVAQSVKSNKEQSNSSLTGKGIAQIRAVINNALSSCTCPSKEREKIAMKVDCFKMLRNIQIPTILENERKGRDPLRMPC